jgi:pyruvate formate lyase activating enzyme
MGPYLDVFRVDIKAFSSASYGSMAHIPDFTLILEATKRAQKTWGMWVEVVTNVTPGYNDSEEELRGIGAWIHRELGAHTPWHLTRFHPHLKLSHVEPTPISILEKAKEWAHQEGLHYVYLGNVPGHPGENTYCHRCGCLLVKRQVFDVLEYHIHQGKCKYCQTQIPGRFA